jgi:hypothetical protein
MAAVAKDGFALTEMDMMERTTSVRLMVGPSDYKWLAQLRDKERRIRLDRL